MTQRPQRRATDHLHPEYWEEAEQHRYEDRVARKLDSLEHTVNKLGERLLLLFGGLGLLAFLLPIIAPFVRSLIGLP